MVLTCNWALSEMHCIFGTPHIIFNPLTPRAFCQKYVFWTFWWFWGWILAKLAFFLIENAFATLQLAFLSTRIAFCGILARACAEVKILIECLDEKVTYVFRLFNFGIFFPLSIFSFSFLFDAVIDLLLGLLVVKKFLRRHQQGGQF